MEMIYFSLVFLLNLFCSLSWVLVSFSFFGFVEMESGFFVLFLKFLGGTGNW